MVLFSMPSTIEKELEQKIIEVLEEHYISRGGNRPTLARIAENHGVYRVDIHDYFVENGLSQEYRYGIGKRNIRKLQELKDALYS